VRWQDLKDLFRKAGTVLRADVSLGPDNRSRGYGTVLLSSAEDAGRAIDMFNGYNWQTRILEVRPDRLPADVELSLGVVPTSLAAVSAVPSPIGQYGPIPGMFLDERSTSSSRLVSAAATNRTLFVGNVR
jgi:RNA recognition motif-containing protein